MRVLTAPGLSGVAVVAFENDERARVAPCLRTAAGRPFAFAGAGRPRLATLQLGGETVDEVLVVERGARGFELHLHGSPAVLAAVAEAFPRRQRDAAAGAGAESPAERLLRSALSVEQLDLALEQRAVDFPRFVAGLDALRGAERDQALAAARERSRIALAHVEPARLVLAGAQNAGKSTLFNRLLFRERALTGPLPGLTRDPVRELTTLRGYPFDVADTAGEGGATSRVDAGAIARGRRLRDGAVMLVVVDRSRGPSAADRELAGAANALLVVANKRDLRAAPWPEDLRADLDVSATSDPPADLRRRIGERLAAARGLPPAGPVGGPAALSRDQLAALEGL